MHKKDQIICFSQVGCVPHEVCVGTILRNQDGSRSVRVTGWTKTKHGGTVLNTVEFAGGERRPAISCNSLDIKDNGGPAKWRIATI